MHEARLSWEEEWEETTSSGSSRQPTVCSRSPVPSRGPDSICTASVSAGSLQGRKFNTPECCFFLFVLCCVSQCSNMMTDQLSESDTSCLCSSVSKLDTTSSGSRSSINT